MLLRILFCHLPWLLAADCSGAFDAPGAPAPGLPLPFARQVAANGSVIPLQQGAIQDPLPSGSSRSLDCHDVHWGLVGTGTLLCDGTSFEVSTVGCVRNGCPWHRLSLVDGGATYAAPNRNLAVPGAVAEAPSKWTAPVLAWDGALYAAPLAADNVLRVAEGASGTEVALIAPSSPLSGSFAKYGAVVLGDDGFVYCIPYSATQVMRIDPVLAAEGNSSALQLFGDVGTAGYKWLHGVASQQGSIFAVPAGASTVLVINTQLVTISELAIGQPLAASLQNYIHAVLSPDGDIFGIPADATFVLWIQPDTQAVTGLGSLGADSLKWMHGLVGVDGRIYCMPGSALAVLRIDPSVDPPALNESLGVGLLDATTRKWSHAVNAPDGRIFGIPQGASQVLVIDPFTDSVDLIGPSWGGGLFKWQYGVLALDQCIYAIPDSAERVLKITPNASGTDIVEEVLLGFTLPGERKFTGAALSPSGSIYAFPAYAAEVLSIMPESDVCLAGPVPKDAVCTLGQECTVGIEPIPNWPSAVTGRNGTLWLIPEASQCGAEPLEVQGYTNPLTTSLPGGDKNRSYSFGIGFAGNVSLSHKLCWAPFETSLDVLELGWFGLLGPRQDHQAICILGLPCSLGLLGEGLEARSWLMLVVANASMAAQERCSSPDTNATIADFQGFENPTASFNSSTGGTSTFFSFATAVVGVVGTYQLCWSPAQSTPSTQSFVIHTGTLVMNGPYLNADGPFVFRCWVGFPCEIAVAGLGLSSDNQLEIAEGACNSSNRSLMSLPDFTSLATTSEGTTYALGTATQASVKTFVVCWLATESAAGIDFGTLSVFGPVDGGTHVMCVFNETCNVTLDSMVGSLSEGFDSQTYLQLEKSGSCSGVPAPLWSNLSNPVPQSPVENSTMLAFDLRTPLAETVSETEMVVGNYSLCLSLNGTTGPFSMTVGSLIVEDVPCAVPDDILDSLEPSCQSEDTGLPVFSLRHAEGCLPRCNDVSIALVPSLQCVYGELQPPRWQCWKSCLQVPSVNNGLGQESCQGLQHGSQCDLNCPAGTRASGFFLCLHGIFYHQALLPLELLFGVPRCYQGCDATAFCGADGQLLHGERCNVVCPEGSTPDMAEVSCRDGEVQPVEGPDCVPMCISGPDVDFATNVADCVNVVSGTVCSLRCEAGYAKTGNPVCERGVWTEARCLAPCSQPEVDNASDTFNGACESLLVGQVVPHAGSCRPSCKPGFTAEVPGGLLQLTCSDGVLSPSGFFCRAACNRVPTVNFADQPLLVQCAGTLHNQTCELPCVGGHVKSGDLVCNDGIFSNASCIKLCYEPPFVANALPILGCSGRPSGAICEIQCADGFSPPPGQSTAICSDGIWSEVRCLQKCPAPLAVDQATQSCLEGSSVPSGGTCTPACREGLEPSEDALSCTEGVLSPPTFSCGRTCGTVGSIANAVPQSLDACTGLRYGKVCMLQCQSGFRATADLLCGNLGWQQHVQIRLRGYDAFQVSQSFFLSNKVRLTPEFTLSMDLAIQAPAETDFLSILHFSATGNGCCNDGDRLPAIFLVPETISATGRKLQVFVDGTPSCLIQTPLALGGFHHLEVSILANILTVRLDGREECEQEVLARMDFPVAAAYAGGPWDAPARVELRNILYSQENLPAVLPSCEEVRCSLPLPAVPGSDEAAEVDTSSCASARAGAVCTAVACPPGSTLTGRFRCGTDGAWRPEPFADASEVRCAEQLCPRVSPNTSGYATECVDRAVGSTCPLACPAGYLSQSGYQCAENGQWTPIPGAAAPDCTPGPCGEPPALSNAVTPEACRGLPSGGTCPGECQPPWQPLFQYRCHAQRWVEVPLCMPPEMLGINGTTVETVPAVTLSTLLEPSGDLRVFYTLEDWTSLAEGSLQLSMQRLLIQAAPATAPLAVHILGKLAEQDTNTGGRRVQSVAELKPAAWKVQLQLAIVPNELATAAASQVLAALDQLPAGQFGDSVVQALPAVARPAVLRASTTAAREVALPQPAAEALAAPEGLVLSSTTTTSTGLSFVARGPAEEQEDDTDNQTAVIEEEGIDEQLLLFLLVVPIACIGGFFVSRRMQRYFTSSHNDATKSDKVDFQFIVEEERLSDDHAADVTVSKVKAYERAQTILAHKERLQEALTTGIQEQATAELEAEKRRQEASEEEQDTERVYDLRDLGASKQLPNVGRAIETLERKKPRHELNGNSMVDTSLQQQSTADIKLRSQVALTPREKRSILKRALCGCIGDAWYSLIEASPCVHRFCIRCCCRCCRRPQQRRQQRVVEETASSSSSDRTPEIPVVRGRRGSVGRVSLSSCTAAEAIADGLERGLDPEQVLAIREFWNFQGAETALEDYDEKKPYKVALRADRGDPSLSSRYKSDAAGGNIVTEKIMQARTYNEEEDAAERMEVHTLKFHPPTRKRIKMEIPPDDDEMESAEEEPLDEASEADDVVVADEDDKPADSGGGASDLESDQDSSSSESASASSAAKGMSALTSALDTDSKINPLMQEIEQIRELDADDVRAAVRRAKERPEYQAAHNRRTEEEGPDEGPKEAQVKLAEPLPKQLDVCTFLPWS